MCSPLEATCLLFIGPVNYKNAKGMPIDTVAALSTVLVKPVYL